MNIFSITSLTQKIQDAKIFSINSFDDANVKCEIGAIHYVLALIAQNFCDELKDLDIGEISGESNVGEEEIDEILEFLKIADYILVDDDINFHFDSKNIKFLLLQISKKFELEIKNLKGENLIFNEKFTPLKECENYDGCVVYEKKGDEFVGGKYFCLVAKIKDGDFCEIKTKNICVKRKFKLDEDLKGTIAILGIDEVKNYPFEVAKIIAL